MANTIPAIDLFAGPGGLSEGFSRYSDGDAQFDVRLSIEKDSVACRTLRLRAFFRQFNNRPVPEAYYEYIRGDSSKLRELQCLHEWKIAAQHVRQWTLGSAAGDDGHVTPKLLHNTINDALLGVDGHWVLLGGPPCQAYSLIGRSRMQGVGAKLRGGNDIKSIVTSRKKLESAFAYDHRHTLYREYLRVVAVHQPAAFVMENVKGILSARIAIEADAQGNPSKYAKIFDQIRRDLSDPWAALSDDPDVADLRSLNRRFKRPTQNYQLYSFVRPATDAWAGLENEDFIIQSETYGVPQSRHRVILLGIRSDISSVHLPLQASNRQRTVREILGGMPVLRSGLSGDKATTNAYGTDSAAAWLGAIEAESEKLIEKLDDPRVLTRIKKAAREAKAISDRGGPFVACPDSFNGSVGALRRFIEDKRLAGVIQHNTRSHMASDLGRYLYLAAATDGATLGEQQTPKLTKWPTFLLPNHANVRSSGRKRVVDGFVDRFRVQVWDRPASTVTSHIHKDGHYFVHPDPKQCRSLTVREAARVQTFPDNYFFEGNRTQQFLQVGNAVPPFLALQLARSVAALFRM